jgi:hypothetical protein
MTLLESLKLAAPYFQLVMKGDVTLGVIDKQSGTYLCYLPSSKLDFGFRDGDRINPDDQIVQHALKGKEFSATIPDEVYGIPLRAAAFPIKDGSGVVMGALAFGFPLDKQVKLEQYMDTINEITNNLQDKIHVVASHSEELAATSEEISTQSEVALEDSKKTHSVIDFIRSISQQTNLLGLNASIEAARAGQHGAGFNIVAQEVRKLSNETSNATQSIDTSLKSITSNINSLKESMKQITGASNEQATLVQDFSEIIEKLNTTSEEMKIFMREIMN